MAQNHTELRHLLVYIFTGRIDQKMVFLTLHLTPCKAGFPLIDLPCFMNRTYVLNIEVKKWIKTPFLLFQLQTILG